MEKQLVLLVEDEPFLARVIKDSLEQKGYELVHADDGHRAYSYFMTRPFDLCIIDVMLPGMDGFTLVGQIRAHNKTVPVLFLTARSATADVISGYAAGGNDYLKKPFSLEELYLRINELLKRNTVPEASVPDCFIGSFLFSSSRQSLSNNDGSLTRLSHRESALLLLLYQTRHTLLERKYALVTLWGIDNFSNARTMDVFITKLRKYLKADASVEIVNVRGLGYRLIC